MKRIPDNLLNAEERARGLQWYSDELHDLFLWRTPSGRIRRFQLTIGKGTPKEVALDWKRGNGPVRFSLVDSGDEPVPYKRSPILLAEEEGERKPSSEALDQALAGVDSRTARFVLDRIRGSAHRGWKPRSSSRGRR